MWLEKINISEYMKEHSMKDNGYNKRVYAADVEAGQWLPNQPGMVSP